MPFEGLHKGPGPDLRMHRKRMGNRNRLNKLELTSVAALLGDTPETISSRYLHPTAEMLQSEVERAFG